MQNPLPALQSFIFGAGTDTPTYESLKKRRAVADALAKQAMQPVENWGDGVGNIMRALGSRMMDKSISKGEDAERERIAAELARIQGALPEQGIPQSAYEQLGEMRQNPYISPGAEGVARSLMRRQVAPGFGEGDIPQDIINRHTQMPPQQPMNGPQDGTPFGWTDPGEVPPEGSAAPPQAMPLPPPQAMPQTPPQAPPPMPRQPMNGPQDGTPFGWTDPGEIPPEAMMGGSGADMLMGGGRKDKVEEPEASVRGDVKLTEGQSKDLNFWNRMDATTSTIDAHTPDLTAAGERMKDAIPLVGNMMVSDGYQVGRRAADEWITALLRKDTGAAVTPEEWRLYGPIYIPQPGDGEPVLKAKAEARARAAEGMKTGLGTAEVLAQELLAARQQAAPSAPAPDGGDWRSKDPSTWTDEQLQEYLK
jgi:hypothetical protein